MRAEACALSVRIGSCQPCQDRALTPMPSSSDGEQSGGDLLAGGDHRIVFAGIVQHGACRGTSSTS